MNKFSLEKARKSAKKVNTQIEKKVMSDPEMKALYERKHHELEIALLMRKTREKAHLSQEDVAQRMHTTRSAVSRIEACGTRKHSLSILMLLKYAQAIGCSVKINFVPENGNKKIGSKNFSTH